MKATRLRKSYELPKRVFRHATSTFPSPTEIFHDRTMFQPPKWQSSYFFEGLGQRCWQIGYPWFSWTKVLRPTVNLNNILMKEVMLVWVSHQWMSMNFPAEFCVYSQCQSHTAVVLKQYQQQYQLNGHRTRPTWSCSTFVCGSWEKGLYYSSQVFGEPETHTFENGEDIHDGYLCAAICIFPKRMKACVKAKNGYFELWIFRCLS